MCSTLVYSAVSADRVGDYLKTYDRRSNHKEDCAINKCIRPNPNGLSALVRICFIAPCVYRSCIHYTDFYINLDGDFHEVEVDEDYTIKNLCEANGVDWESYAFMHQGVYLLRNTKLRKINATRDKPLVIKEFKVFYRYLQQQSYVYSSPFKNINGVLRELSLPDVEQLVTKIDGVEVGGGELLKFAKTSEQSPLVIDPFCCWLQNESLLTQKYCNPNTSLRQLAQDTSFAYHDGKRICNLNLPIKKFSTSKENPIRFRQPIIKVTLDNNEEDYDLPHNYEIGSVISHLECLFNVKLQKKVYNINSQEVIDLDGFILQSTEEQRRLFLKTLYPTTPTYHHGSSVSQTASNHPENINDGSVLYSLCSHWISVKIYNATLQKPTPDAAEFANKFHRIMEVKNYTPKVLNDFEIVYTSVFFRALDRFLFKDANDGCVLHQPCLQMSSKPDGYVATLTNHQPSYPILVSDFKRDPDEYNKAFVESLGYFQCIAQSLYRDIRPMLVMPCTPTRLSLYLCWYISDKHATIKIFDTEDDKKSDDKFAKFFHTLKNAVDFLPKISCEGQYFQVNPLRNETTQTIQTLSLKSPNVYCKGDKVYKFFDRTTEYWAKPNVDIIKGLLNDYLPDLELHKLTDDKRFFCLTYKFITDSDRSNLSYEKFLPIMDVLDTIHKNDYVHSDVRFQNMVFPSDDCAKLIDFDLLDKVETPYPFGYNTFDERHSDARPSKPRQICHDRYSLAQVITREVQLTSEEKQKLECWKLQNGQQ